MKKLFFIGFRQILRYNLSRYNANNYLVLIVGNKDKKRVPSKIKSQFQKIYYVEESCDEQEILCEYDYRQVSEIISSELITNEQSFIFCQDEANVELVAELREKFDIEGARPKDVLPFRNKMEMKLKVANNNLRVPKNLYLEQNSDFIYYENLKMKLGANFIIKPINSAATNGVYLVNSYEDFEYFFNSLYNKIYTYEVEEFITGKMFHVDTVVYNKKIYFVECCIFNRPPLDFLNGYSSSSFPIKTDNKIVKDFAISCVKALGMPNGIQHTEVFMNNMGEMVFIESGARAPGLFVVDLYKESFGINILDLEVSLFIGDDKVNNRKSTEKHGFSVIWPTKIGVLKKINLPQLIGKYDFVWNYNEGDELNKSKSGINILAYIIVYNESYENALSDFEVLKKIEIAEFV